MNSIYSFKLNTSARTRKEKGPLDADSLSAAWGTASVRVSATLGAGEGAGAGSASTGGATGSLRGGAWTTGGACLSTVPSCISIVGL